MSEATRSHTWHVIVELPVVAGRTMHVDASMLLLLVRQVSVEEATEFARRQAMMYVEASAKTRAGAPSDAPYIVVVA